MSTAEINLVHQFGNYMLSLQSPFILLQHKTLRPFHCMIEQKVMNAVKSEVLKIF